jgi:hypothetical protein
LPIGGCGEEEVVTPDAFDSAEEGLPPETAEAALSVAKFHNYSTYRNSVSRMAAILPNRE